MTFAVLLSLVVVFMGIYTLVFMRKRLVYLLLPCYAFTLLVVWQPQISTFIARKLGVGRGLDLFLMLGTVLLINAAIVIARHINVLHQRQTELARDIALYRAHIENGTKPLPRGPKCS